MRLMQHFAKSFWLRREVFLTTDCYLDYFIALQCQLLVAVLYFLKCTWKIQMHQLMAITIMMTGTLVRLTAHTEWQGHDERCCMNNNSPNVFLLQLTKHFLPQANWKTFSLVIMKKFDQFCLFHSVLNSIHILDQNTWMESQLLTET